MNPQPLPLLPLSVSVTAVVRQFDQQLLDCVEDEALSAAQHAELLAWAHGHLLVAYVAVHLDALLILGEEAAESRLIDPCLSVIDILENMLQGAVPLEKEDLTFHCPPVCCECVHALRGRLLAWVQKRIRLAAQRTRWHTDAELARLWEAVEAHLIVGSIVWFELADWLEVDVPAAETLEAATRGCLKAISGARGLAWTPNGAVLE